jgi:hypothetical protein
MRWDLTLEGEDARPLADYAEQIGEWRSHIVIDPAWDQIVAKQLTGQVVDQWAAISAQIAKPMALIGEQLVSQVREITESYMGPIRTALQQAVQPVAMASAFEWGTRMRAWAEEARQCDIALKSMGWWFPLELSNADFMRIGRLAIDGKRVAVRQEMTKLAHGGVARALVEKWMDTPSFRRRRCILLDGVADHEQGRYRVSIPTLLPSIEGILVQEFRPGSWDKSPKLALQAANGLADDSIRAAIVDTGTFLYGGIDFAATPARSRQLNRHFILHGHSIGYGTETNSVQVLFTLDQVHTLVAAKAKAPKPAN